MSSRRAPDYAWFYEEYFKRTGRWPPTPTGPLDARNQLNNLIAVAVKPSPLDEMQKPSGNEGYKQLLTRWESTKSDSSTGESSDSSEDESRPLIMPRRHINK